MTARTLRLSVGDSEMDNFMRMLRTWLSTVFVPM
jgi:hypothetical protein